MHMWGNRGKARKCPIGTVSVCLRKTNVGKLQKMKKMKYIFYFL